MNKEEIILEVEEPNEEHFPTFEEYTAKKIAKSIDEYVFKNLIRQNKELQQKVNQLEEENKSLQVEIDLLNDNRIYLNKKIADAIEFIDIYTDGINLEAFDCLKLMYRVKEILERGK